MVVEARQAMVAASKARLTAAYEAKTREIYAANTALRDFLNLLGPTDDITPQRLETKT